MDLTTLTQLRDDYTNAGDTLVLFNNGEDIIQAKLIDTFVYIGEDNLKYVKIISTDITYQVNDDLIYILIGKIFF
jgi:hypothetical protein